MSTEQLEQLINEIELSESAPVPLAYSRKGLIRRSARYALFAIVRGAGVVLAVLEYNGREYDAEHPIYIASSPEDAADVWRVYA